MAKKKSVKDNDDFDEEVDASEAEDESFDDYEEIEFKKTSHKHSSNARRRHEQLKEDRALERLLSSDFDYFDDYNSNDFNDYADYVDPYEWYYILSNQFKVLTIDSRLLLDCEYKA